MAKTSPPAAPPPAPDPYPDVPPLSLWQVATPDLPPSIGQGPPPSALIVEADGQRYELAHGLTVKASDTVAMIADLDATPPLVRRSLIATLAGAFTPVSPAP